MSTVCVIITFVLALGLAEAALRIDNEAELREAQAALFNADSTSGWLLLNYVGPRTVHFAAGGEGTESDVVGQLEDDQIQYILIREKISDEEIRDVFIAWIGPAVGITEKRKKTAFKGDAEAILQPFHSSLFALNRDNFNDDKIIDSSSPDSSSQVIN